MQLKKNYSVLQLNLLPSLRQLLLIKTIIGTFYKGHLISDILRKKLY